MFRENAPRISFVVSYFMKVGGPRPADDTLIMILRSYSQASNIVNFAIRERGNRGGGRGRTARTENGRKGDKATRRKRDLTHCKAGDDNRLTSALSSSGSSSSLETQLIFVIMPHPHLPPLVASLLPPLVLLPPPASIGSTFLTPSLPSSCRRTRFNEISCHRDICLSFPLFFVLSAAKENPATISSRTFVMVPDGGCLGVHFHCLAIIN